MPKAIADGHLLYLIFVCLVAMRTALKILRKSLKNLMNCLPTYYRMFKCQKVFISFLIRFFSDFELEERPIRALKKPTPNPYSRARLAYP